jgi:methyl-accepting chemotaxis protein
MSGVATSAQAGAAALADSQQAVRQLSSMSAELQALVGSFRTS